MAVIFVHGTGNDVNPGTELLPKLTRAGAAAIAATGDVIRFKSGYTYTDTPPGAATAFMPATFITNYVADGANKPIILFDGRSATAANKFTITSGTVFKQLEIKYDWQTITSPTAPLGAVTAITVTFDNCIVQGIRTGGTGTGVYEIFPTFSNVSFRMNINNCMVIGDGETSKWVMGSVSAVAGTIEGCTFKNISFGINGFISGFSRVLSNKFYGMKFATTGLSFLFDCSQVPPCLYVNNTIVIEQDSGTVANNYIFKIGLSTSLFTGSARDNIIDCYKTQAVAQYSPVSAQTYPDNFYFALGNNAIKGLSSIFANSTNPREDYTPSIILAASPFISIVEGNPNFLKLDTTTASGLACIGSAYTGGNKDLGAIQSSAAGAGETDANKVLNTSTLITGLYVPITNAGLVATGTSFGVGLTGTRTAAIASNVKAGTPIYGDPAAPITPTLPLNKLAPSIGGSYLGEESNSAIDPTKLQFGYSINNLGSTVNGLDKGAAFNSDPGEANTRLGIAYKNLNATNNKTGTAAIPTASQTLAGVAVDATLGNVILPSINNVIIHPTTGVVNYGAAGALTGVFEVPTESFVDSFYGQYGANGNEFTSEYIRPNLDWIISGTPAHGPNGTFGGNAILPSLNYLDISETIFYDGIDHFGLLTLPDPDFILVSAGDYGPPNNPISPTIPLNKVLETHGGTIPLNKLAPSQGGGYYGSENNTVIDPTKLQFGYAITNLNLVVNGLDKGASFNTKPANIDVRIGAGGTHLDVPYSGELDVDAEANHANPLNVKAGSGNYGKNLDKIPALPLNKISPSQGGTSVGEESNDEILPEDYTIGKPYLNLGINKVGELTGGDTDPKFILKTTVTPQGLLGITNPNGLDISKQIRDSFLFIMQNNLIGYKKIDNLETIGDNVIPTNAKRYGIRYLELSPVNELIGADCIVRRFEIVLTTDYIANSQSDAKKIEAQDELIQRAELVRRLANETILGAFDEALEIVDIDENQTEFIADSNLVILRIKVGVKLALPKYF